MIRLIKTVMILLSLVMVSAMALTSCSKKAEEVGGKILIKYGTIETQPNQQEAIGKIIKAFEAEHPNIKIKLEADPQNKILIQLAGNSAPDVFWWHAGQLAEYASRGSILDVGDFFKNDKEISSTDYYFRVGLEGCKYQGKLYGLPIQLNTGILCYNKTLFDEAGLEYPNSNWTLNEFLNAAIKLTRDKNNDGKMDTFGAIIDGLKESLVYMNGARIFDEDGKRCLLDSPKAIEALQFWADMRNKYRIAPTEQEAKVYGGVRYFITGRIGMVIGPSWILTELLRIKNFEWDVAPVPKSFDGTYRWKQGVIPMMNCIWAKTKHPKEAWEFLKFFSSKKGMGLYAKAKNGIPPVREIAYSPLFNSPPPEHIQLFVDELERSIPEKMFPGRSEVESTIISSPLENMYQGNLTAKEAVAEIIPKANRFLQEVRHE